LCRYKCHIFEERHYYSTNCASAITIPHLFEPCHYVRLTPTEAHLQTYWRSCILVWTLLPLLNFLFPTLISLTCGVSHVPTCQDLLQPLAAAAPLATARHRLLGTRRLVAPSAGDQRRGRTALRYAASTRSRPRSARARFPACGARRSAAARQCEELRRKAAGARSCAAANASFGPAPPPPRARQRRP
jgi:hypothetical protein